MQVRYDLHIHSGLSPCAEKDMTPVNIVGYAKLNGIDIIAIADHNAINNVEVAIMAGEYYGVTVVPAMELQTNEDIHLLCLFKTFENLKAFYDSIEFTQVANNKDIFGAQLIFDEDDNIVGEVENLLLTSATIGSYETKCLADKFDGLAIPAHIDRDSNGMVQILGMVTEEFDIVELSNTASKTMLAEYMDRYTVIIDSDAHTLEQIKGAGVMELADITIDALFAKLKAGIN